MAEQQSARENVAIAILKQSIEHRGIHSRHIGLGWDNLKSLVRYWEGTNNKPTDGWILADNKSLMIPSSQVSHIQLLRSPINPQIPDEDPSSKKILQSDKKPVGYIWD